MKKLKRILFISNAYPRASDPCNCPPVGYKLAHMRKEGVIVNILSLEKASLLKSRNFLHIIKFFLVLLLPIITIERHKFIGEEYKIFRAHYGRISKIFLPIFLYILIRINQYDVFSYQFLWSTTELPFLKRVFNKPSVITIHGSDLHETAVENLVEYEKFKFAIKTADKIIYVSKGLRKISEDIGLSSNKDLVITNGYDPEIFKVNQKKAKFPVFGFVGHLYSVKRADKLPEIFNLIKKSIPNAKLIIVGGGIKKQNLRLEMEKGFKEYGIEEDIEFVGEVLPNEVANYYSEMDVLLFPSRREGFGAVVIEARACGIPVVGSDNGGIPEAVGEGGIIVKDGRDFERRFASAAVNLYRDLPSRDTINKGVSRYSWPELVKIELALYEKLIKFN